jgi:3-oxoacyl-[acyl-carrier protein] reductase
MMKNNKTALVTGASRGIGMGIALRFAKEGFSVMIFGRDEGSLKKVQHQIIDMGVKCESFTGGVEDEEFALKSVKSIEERFGNIDVLINNAGTRVFKKVVDADLADFKKQVDANLYGVFNFTKAVLPGMIREKKGDIITIASLAGKNPFATGSMYCATKHAVLGFSRSLMLEVREYNIRVAAICPGSVDTEFFDGLSMKPNKEKILKVEDVAESVMSIINLPAGALASEIDLRPTNPN